MSTPRRPAPRSRGAPITATSRGTASTLTGGEGLLEHYFGFTARGTTLARDSMAGVTTFVVMSYIIFVNPSILTGVTHPPLGAPLAFSAVLTSTCLVAGALS